MKNKKKNVMISLDEDLIKFYKEQGLCLSKEVQLYLKYIRENRFKPKE